MKINALTRLTIYNQVLNIVAGAKLAEYFDMFISETNNMITYFEEHGNLKQHGCETCLAEDYPTEYCKVLAVVDHTINANK